MSLINDALKRAKHSQQQQPAPAPPLMPALPVHSESHGGANWLFAVLIVALIVVSCFLILLAVGPRKQIAHSAPPAAPAQYAQTAPPSSVLPKAAVTPPPAAIAPTQTVAVVAPPPPALKVQGIFYNSARPQAIVNGQTVYIGDDVNGFRVKQISKDEVSFTAPDGSEKTLALGE